MTKRRPRARPELDEDACPGVVGDEVELALGPTPVARDDAEASPLEQLGREVVARRPVPGREASRSEATERALCYDAGVAAGAAGAEAAPSSAAPFSPLMRAALPCSSRR
jgi:hypothetical protein